MADNPDADDRSADDTVKQMAGALEAPLKDVAPVSVRPFEAAPHDLQSSRKKTKKVVKKKARAEAYKKVKANTPKTPSFIKKFMSSSI